MAKTGPTAQRQIDNLIDHYLRIDRPEAAAKLRAAVAAVLVKIDDPTTRSRAYPAIYSGLSALRMAWIKEHIYWFGYGPASDGIMTIANVIWERADIPARAEPFEESMLAA